MLVIAIVVTLSQRGAPGESVPATTLVASAEDSTHREDSLRALAKATPPPVAARDPASPRSADRGGTGSEKAPGRVPAPAAALTDDEIREALNELRQWTDPTSGTESSAAHAITQVPKLLPFLRTAGDSVAARYYLADGYLLRADAKHACSVLLAIREQAQSTRFRLAVENYLTDPDLGCR
jgi:hypothetical protein